MTRLITVLLLLCLSQVCKAEQTIQIAVGEWPPYISRDLPDQGPVAHYVEKVFEAAGYTVEYKWLPWPRILPQLVAGNYPVSLPWGRHETDESLFYYSSPLMSEEHFLFYNQQKPIDWNNISDLQELAIGANAICAFSDEFNHAEHSGALNVVRVNSDQQLIRMLLKKRLDVAVMDMKTAQALLSKSQLGERISVHPQQLSKRNLHLIFSKLHPQAFALQQAFERGHNMLLEAGTLPVMPNPPIPTPAH